MYVQYFLLLLFQLVFGFPELSEWRCGNGDKHFNDVKVIKSNAISVPPFVPLEIYYDFTHMEAQIPFINPDYLLHIKNVLEESKQLFKKLLRGLKEPGKLIITLPCAGLKMSEIVKTQGVDANLVIIPFFDNTLDDQVLAYASSCIMSAWPLVGFIGINSNPSTYKKPNSFSHSLSIIMHEMTHIFAFSDQLFKYYRDENFQLRTKVNTTMIVDGMKRDFIVTPKVVETAKKHFRCNTLIGVEVENQGGQGTAGSHWEARVMFGDYMMGSIMDEMVISEITLALFEDSGWYKANYYTGGLFRFGKHEGCAFLNQKCIQNQKTAFKRAYCDVKAQPFCSNGRSSKGDCYIAQQNIPKEYQYFSNPSLGGFSLADYCPISIPNSQAANLKARNCKLGDDEYKAYGEVLSDSSLCFISSLSNTSSSMERSICYPLQCNFTSNTTTVFALKTNITCPSKGGLVKLPLLTGYIKCPVFTDVCTTLNWCTDIKDCILKQAEPLMNSDIIPPAASSIKLMANMFLIAFSALLLIS